MSTERLTHPNIDKVRTLVCSERAVCRGAPKRQEGQTRAKTSATPSKEDFPNSRPHSHSLYYAVEWFKGTRKDFDPPLSKNDEKQVGRVGLNTSTSVALHS
eukprot:gb/GECG01008204.1/.p1 GENE.gb/GECG01008204.1/~~gb/GECG01008204.1/.p1  ORF type:complete len:101 (+),score=7.87 gb/GECG01008204.1/:1-303(+)